MLFLYQSHAPNRGFPVLPTGLTPSSCKAWLGWGTQSISNPVSVNTHLTPCISSILTGISDVCVQIQVEAKISTLHYQVRKAGVGSW